MSEAPTSLTLRAGTESFTVETTTTSLQVRGTGARLDRLVLALPEGWEPADGEEPEDFCWELGATASLRVRVRSHPALAIEADLRNLTDDVLTLVSPTLVVCGADPMVAWLGGAAGEVVVPHPDGAVLLTQRRGFCAPAGDPRGVGIALFGAPVLVRPGQIVGAAWAQTQFPPAVVPPEPAWLPGTRYVDADDPVVVSFPDGGLVADGLHVASAADGIESWLSGPPGLHRVSVADARGTTSFEVGWHVGLLDLVEAALDAPDVPVDVAAWLRTWSISRGVDVDQLDLELATALESPTLWGLLAGLRAVTHTELPVTGDVREAARTLAAQHPTSEAIPILAAHSLASGVPLPIADHLFHPPAGALPEAWELLGGPDELGAQLLADVEFGRISSEPPSFTGRHVALADLWLASRPDAPIHLELGRAVDVARKRLMCQYSDRPDPLGVAWLLVGHGLG